MQQIRKKIIVFFTFIGGLYFFLEFILPADISGFKFGIYHEEVSLGVQLIGLMAIGLGIITSLLSLSFIVYCSLKRGVNLSLV